MILLLTGGELLHADALQRMLNRSVKHYLHQHKVKTESMLAEFDASRAALIKMTSTELNIPSARQLERFDVNIVPTETVTAVELMLLRVREYSMRVSALTHGIYRRSSKKEVESFTTQSLADNGLILALSDASGQVAWDVNSEGLLAQYSKLSDEEAQHDFLNLSFNTFWERLNMLLTTSEYGTDMTMPEIGERFRTRGTLAKDSFISFLDVLTGTLNQAQLARLQQADLQVGWNIYARAIIPKFGRMVSPGVVIQAKIYEFGARVAALKGEDDLVELSLSLILRLQENPDDHVIMTVSPSEDSYPLRLEKNSLEEIVTLYRQKIN